MPSGLLTPRERSLILRAFPGRICPDAAIRGPRRAGGSGWRTDFQRFSANGVLRCGIGPLLTTYTPTEIMAIATHSIVEGNSPRIGMPIRAVIAGVKARNAAPLVAPSMLTMRP